MNVGESEFVKRRIYLTLERGRDVCLRNLLRKVYLAAGVDDEGKRRTRIRIEEFAAAIRLGEGRTGDQETGFGKDKLENDEVECMVCNIIYKVRPPSPSSVRLFSNNTQRSESDERLHLSRSRRCRPLQDWCLPWNANLKAT